MSETTNPQPIEANKVDNPGEARTDQIKRYIDTSFPNRLTDYRERRMWHQAHVMWAGYRQQYGDNDLNSKEKLIAGGWTVLDVEREFAVPIVNPETGAKSRSFYLRGKIDMLASDPAGKICLVEHKTASQIDGNYIEKLPMDFQIALYTDAVERDPKISVNKIDRVNYNVAAKKPLKQGVAESDADYKTRCAKLIARSKTGKTSAKQGVAEPDADFRARLLAYYVGANAPTMFHREELFVSPDQIAETRYQIWEITQQILAARRSGPDNGEMPGGTGRIGMWYKNPDHCEAFRRFCEYWPICSSRYPENVIENEYACVAAHEELSDPIPAWAVEAGLTTLTYSSIRCFRNCRMKYNLRYRAGLRKIRGEGAEALWLGQVWHGVLERVYKLRENQK